MSWLRLLLGDLVRRRGLPRDAGMEPVRIQVRAAGPDRGAVLGMDFDRQEGLAPAERGEHAIELDIGVEPERRVPRPVPGAQESWRGSQGISPNSTPSSLRSLAWSGVVWP